MLNKIINSDSHFRALFEYANEGIVVTDSDATIIMANPAIEKLFGYAKDSLKGKKIEVLIPERVAERHVQYRQQYNKAPHARSMGIGMNLYARKQTGEEFPVEVSLSPFTIEDKKFIIAFVIDITARKKNEDAIRQQNAELEKMANELEKRVKDRTLILEEALQQLENSREELSDALEKEKELNELKSRFVSMASHEFRTPLATIMSSLSLVIKYAEKGDAEKQQKHTQRIKSAIAHMTDILNDVLSVSKLEEGKIIITPEEFELPEFVSLVIQELQSLAKQGQHIAYTHNGEAIVCLDKKIVRIILFNLVSNAIKFSNEDQWIHVSTQVTDKQISIQVKDEGIGISAEDKEHLFERFFRAHNATNIQGTGLGLNIITKYLEIMSGDIQVESELGAGSTFIIHIPNNTTHE